MSLLNSKYLIIVVGPSGVGKSTFVDRIVSEMPVLHDAVTCTTRSPRSGETEGNPYFFLTREEFESRIKGDFFVEWAHVHTNLYGTPVSQLENPWSEGKAVIMDVDVQGAQTIMSKHPQSLTIFIHPPSMKVLQERIIEREPQVPGDLDLRLENAKKEMALASSFDCELVNDDFEKSYGAFKKIIEDYIKER